jgi:transposase
MAGKKGMKTYPVVMKLEAMRLFIEEGKTRAEITQVLGLPSEEPMKEWVKRYHREGELTFKRPKARPRKKWDEATSHPAIGDGECSAKKISYRVAKVFACET